MLFEGKNFLTAPLVGFLSRITPHCHDVTRLLSQSMDHQLPWGLRSKLYLHYTFCVWCERYGQQLQILRKASRQIADKNVRYRCERMPDESRERVRQNLQTIQEDGAG